MSGAAGEALAPLVRAIEEEFVKAPPTIAVIGLSGVGKSSTINVMFGTDKRVSATTRGTSRFNSKTLELASNRVDGSAIRAALRVIDAPGLGEDITLDQNYLARYRHHLPKADIALWVVAARNRALALDQRYLEQLADRMPRLVIGINQVDLADPVDWNEAINMPSSTQADHISGIVEDRREKLARYARNEAPAVVAYSARRYYNLQALFLACIKSAPPERRWMFELLKSFSTFDWLERAKGLSEAQKRELAKRYIASDAKIELEKLARVMKS